MTTTLTSGKKNAAVKAGRKKSTVALATDATSPKDTARSKSGQQKQGADVRIYDAVRNAVMTQRLRPGTKLSESSLCELFKVSRTLVRQALQKLAHDHIVELRPNRGAVVASPTPAETRDVFFARRTVEAAILPLAVANATPLSIQSLRQKLRAGHDALETGDHASWVRMAAEFHLALADMAGNHVLKGFLVELLSRCSLIVALYEAPGDAPCEHEEHERIVDFIEHGDTEAALALMHQHLVDLEQRIRLEPDEPEIDLAAILGVK